jgi:uncharacterized protein
MALRRVWKEQMITVPVRADDLVLEAVWQAGGPRGAVVAPPHPQYGGSFEHPVCNELAYAFFQEGLASVRFNWRGVGASQGEITGDPGAAARDYAAALEHLAATLDGPLIAAGYSFGAATALRVALADPRVSALVLIAPPPSLLAPVRVEAGGEKAIHVITGTQDRLAPTDELRALLRGVPGVRLSEVDGADHFFARGLASLVDLTRAAV